MRKDERVESVTYRPIGVIHTPFTKKEGTPIQPVGAAEVRATVEVFPEYVEGLADLNGFSHVILLYHFHRAGPAALTVIPFMDREPRGLFATRAPVRPNPIGLSIVALEAVEGNVLRTRGVDVLDGTPLLDIKPYAPAFDHREGARAGWLERTGHGVKEARDDGRFNRK